MKRVLFLPIAVLLTSAASAQVLDCPGSASRSSDAFHFHVQMYRPDTRGFFDAWGINQFASQSACDRARESAMKRNLAVVSYFKQVRGDNQYEPDRFGTCHADMSLDKTNPRYLTDAQRIAQIRGAEDVRQRIRERLLDAGLTTDSEVFRSVALPLAAAPALLAGPRLVAMPQAAMVETTYAASDLKSTRAIESSKPAIASLDLPLVDIVAGASATPRLVQPAVVDAPAGTPAVAAGPQPSAAQPVATPAPTTAAAPEASSAPAPAVERAAVPAAEAQPVESAEDVADSFVAYETQRIQNVLKASAVIGDESVKAKIYDACMQRIQLLSNLRSLIEVSGAKSRLAAQARAARTEDERLVFVAKLFGDDMKSHWAPKDATDVILGAEQAIDTDSDRVLRDATNHYSEQQKRHALYVLLARGQPTEEQQLWLTTIADSFLQ